MSHAYALRRAASAEDFAEAKRLLEIYGDDAHVPASVTYYWREVDHPRLVYGRPGSGLILALDGRRADGCCGYIPVPEVEGLAEMKRLYVDPAARGHQLGRRLVRATIGAIRGDGYRRIGLFTVARRERALALYRSLDFAPCAPFKRASVAEPVFLSLDLEAEHG